MKLGEDVLVQIVEAVRKGIAEGVDISDELRKLEVVASPDGQKVVLQKN